jgi:hypothetical protein
MSNSRIAATTEEALTFTHRASDRSKRDRMTLSLDQFLTRYLLHVPAPYTRIIRYYGLYAPTATEELSLCRSLFGPQDPEETEWQAPRKVYPDSCPVCGRPLLRFIDPPHWKEVIPHAA